MQSVQMLNGEVLHKEKIDKLAGYIINKFAEEKLTVDEAKIILDSTKEIVGEFSRVESYRSRSNISCKE